MKRKKRKEKPLKLGPSKLSILKEPLEIEVAETDDLRDFPKEGITLSQQAATFTIKGRK